MSSGSDDDDESDESLHEEKYADRIEFITCTALQTTWGDFGAFGSVELPLPVLSIIAPSAACGSSSSSSGSSAREGWDIHFPLNPLSLETLKSRCTSVLSTDAKNPVWHVNVDRIIIENAEFHRGVCTLPHP
jgi:hypothetical protein